MSESTMYLVVCFGEDLFSSSSLSECESYISRLDIETQEFAFIEFYNPVSDEWEVY